MSIHFFGQYLINQGDISELELDQAIEMTGSASLPIGQVAVQLGYLSYADVELIHQHQRWKDLAFGELAIELGLLQPQALLERLCAVSSHTGAAPIVVTIEDDIKDLIEGFLENRHADVELLTKALETEDFECLRVKGHNTKGVGRNYGSLTESPRSAASWRRRPRPATSPRPERRWTNSRGNPSERVHRTTS